MPYCFEPFLVYIIINMNLNGVDLFKFLFSFAVVAIHAHLLDGQEGKDGFADKLLIFYLQRLLITMSPS